MLLDVVVEKIGCDRECFRHCYMPLAPMDERHERPIEMDRMIERIAERLPGFHASADALARPGNIPIGHYLCGMRECHRHRQVKTQKRRKLRGEFPLSGPHPQPSE